MKQDNTSTYFAYGTYYPPPTWVCFRRCCYSNRKENTLKVCVFCCRMQARESLYSLVNPSIYEFFSSSELFSLSFPFYCLIISTCTHDLAAQAFTPFFTSACTYEFIESVFNKWCTKFCDDKRLSGKSISQKVIDEYCPLDIDAIIKSYSLLPLQHQFLLRWLFAYSFRNLHFRSCFSFSSQRHSNLISCSSASSRRH